MDQNLIVAGVVCLMVMIAIFLINARLRDLLSIFKEKQVIKTREDAVELREREAAAELAELTIANRAERDNARLEAETDEIRSAAAELENPQVQAAILQAHLRRIAAESGIAVQAARREALWKTVGEQLEAVHDQYDRYRRNNANGMTFAQWLGPDVSLRELILIVDDIPAE